MKREFLIDNSKIMKMVNKKIEQGEKVRTDKKKESKKSINENKLLRNILIVLGIILAGATFSFFISNEPPEFNYRGVNFSVVTFCDAKPCLKTYNTKIPVIYEGKKADYNFYLRNDPRTLEEKVPFEGDLNLKEDMTIDITFEQSCQGYESVAMDNFGTLMRVLEVNVTADKSATCDLDGNSMHVLIQEGDETIINKIGPACYVINIKGCEIVSGVERFMTETFVEINK